MTGPIAGATIGPAAAFVPKELAGGIGRAWISVAMVVEKRE
jgi:hypothetical protein